MRRRTAITTVGFVLFGAMLVGLAGSVLIAVRANEPFYGRNAYGLLLGAYSTLATLIMAALIGVVWIVQQIVPRDRKSALLQQTIRWAYAPENNVNIVYASLVDGTLWEVRINDFPTEPLFSLLVSGREVAQFDEWPRAWGNRPKLSS